MTPNDIATTVNAPQDFGAVNGTISQTLNGQDWSDFC